MISTEDGVSWVTRSTRTDDSDDRHHTQLDKHHAMAKSLDQGRSCQTSQKLADEGQRCQEGGVEGRELVNTICVLASKLADKALSVSVTIRSSKGGVRLDYSRGYQEYLQSCRRRNRKAGRRRRGRSKRTPAGASSCSIWSPVSLALLLRSSGSGWLYRLTTDVSCCI